MNVYESILKGLQEAVDYESGKGKAKVRHVTVAPLPEYSRTEIKNVRTSLNLSQLAFSNVLGVSKKTVEAWESGKNTPQGPALRMIDIFKNNPKFVEQYIKEQ